MNTLIASNDPGATSMTDSATSPSTAALAVLHAWAEKGWLRRLDSAMATFLQELDASASPVLLVCTAVLAQMEGRGHTCLPLRILVTSPDEVLAWPALAQAEVQALWSGLPKGLNDWLVALRSSPLVRSFDDSTDLGQPLVLSGTEDEPLLYLLLAARATSGTRNPSALCVQPAGGRAVGGQVAGSVVRRRRCA